jgi:hypothetical protein
MHAGRRDPMRSAASVAAEGAYRLWKRFSSSRIILVPVAGWLAEQRPVVVRCTQSDLAAEDSPLRWDGAPATPASQAWCAPSPIGQCVSGQPRLLPPRAAQPAQLSPACRAGVVPWRRR